MISDRSRTIAPCRGRMPPGERMRAPQAWRLEFSPLLTRRLPKLDALSGLGC